MKKVCIQKSRSWRKWFLGFSDCFEYKVVSQRGLDTVISFNLEIFTSDNMLIRAYT